MNRIALSAGPYSAVATTHGGGLLEFSIERNGQRRNILRPSSLNPATPLDRAMIVMAPWCNRIGGGGFTVGNRFYPIAPNVPGFPMPLHGTAFQSRWTVTNQRDDQISMELNSAQSANFSFRAEIFYQLSTSGLAVRLSVRNTGANAMPFGIGLHPWFETDDQTTLEFKADAQVVTDSLGLPTKIEPVAANFAKASKLPSERIDKTFLGWDGRATLHTQDSLVQMRSSAPLLHVFSPHRDAGFCCLEPQTTIPNGANFEFEGTRMLESDAEVSVTMTISSASRPAPEGN